MEVQRIRIDSLLSMLKRCFQQWSEGEGRGRREGQGERMRGAGETERHTQSGGREGEERRGREDGANIVERGFLRDTSDY